MQRPKSANERGKPKPECNHFFFLVALLFGSNNMRFHTESRDLTHQTRAQGRPPLHNRIITRKTSYIKNRCLLATVTLSKPLLFPQHLTNIRLCKTVAAAIIILAVTLTGSKVSAALKTKNLGDTVLCCLKSNHLAGWLSLGNSG